MDAGRWIPSSAVKELEFGNSEYFGRDELLSFGARSVGDECQISRKVSFHGFNGYIGDCVRIDDWCSIKGNVTFGNFIHIASFSLISGTYAPVKIEDFCGVSSHLALFSGSDDYNADTLNGPWLPIYTATVKGPVKLGIGSLIGAHCLILPNVNIGDGASIGSGCTVYQDIPPGGIVRAAKAILKKERRNHELIKEQCLRVYDSRPGGSC